MGKEMNHSEKGKNVFKALQKTSQGRTALK